MPRSTDLARRWWPPAAVIGAAVAGTVLFHSVYSDAQGHAAGHAGSATAVFPMSAAFAVVVWAVPGSWRSVALRSGGAALGVGLTQVYLGNVRVVRAIGTSDWSDEQAGALGALRPGFESGHRLSELGMWVSVAAVLWIAATLTARRDVSPATGIAAIALTLLVPPWIVPGFGLIVVAVAVCRGRSRQHPSVHEPPAVSPAGVVAAPRR